MLSSVYFVRAATIGGVRRAGYGHSRFAGNQREGLIIMRVHHTGASAVAAVAVFVLAGCGSNRQPVEPATHAAAPRTADVVELSTPQALKKALGMGCMEEGGDFNQKGIAFDDVDHLTCAQTPNGSITSIVYYWKTPVEPPAAVTNLRVQAVESTQLRGDTCLIESAEHRWAWLLFEPKLIGIPAAVAAEIDRGHAKVAAGAC